MRQIKFRAFDDGKMIYEKDIQHLLLEDFEVLRLAKFFCNVRNDSKVMQFTGLKDKNGRDIYEGDILGFWDIDESDYQKFIDDRFPEFNSWDGKKIYKKSPIGWSENAFGWRMPSQSRLKISMKDVEVIGNIYENPDLLK